MSPEQLEAEVLRLLHLVRPLGNAPIRPRRAASLDLLAFERKHQLELPYELKAWLRHCDGAAVSPGGVYSLFTRGPCASMDWFLGEYPAWRDRGWLPVAGAGCGDIYVLASQLVSPGGTHPVFFLDQADWDRPAYLVASGLWRFLYRLFRSEIEPRPLAAWPFDRAAMQLEDPELAVCRGIRLPWEPAENRA